MIEIEDIGPSEKVIKRVVCKNCGATLRYTPRDVKETNGTDYGGGPDGCEYIVCPNCIERVVLKSW